MRAFLFLAGMLVMFILSGCDSSASDSLHPENLSSDQYLYVIERSIPGAGHLTSAELKAIAQTSNNVLKEMGSEIQWMHSYVTGDKIYSLYAAPNEEMVREHARQGGFPANSVEQVASIIDPSTASK